MLNLCNQLLEAGYTHYAIAAIYERMRWHFNVDLAQPGDAEYSFCNDFKSIYARKLMKENPQLKDFFELRPWRRGDVTDAEFDAMVVTPIITVVEPPYLFEENYTESGEVYA